MKAIRVKQFGGPEVLQVEEVPTPQPGPGDVLVCIHAAGVNPVETYIRSGTYARLPKLPYTPGNDGAGVVEQVGADVSKFKAGDRVYTAGSLSGTYAEFALCNEDQVHPLPNNISFAQGAAMGTPYATAYRGLLQRAAAKPGETVLVHGASGGVGTASVQLGYARGLRVFGTAGSDEGFKLVRERVVPLCFCDDCVQQAFANGKTTLTENECRKSLTDFVDELQAETRGLLIP